MGVRSNFIDILEFERRRMLVLLTHLLRIMLDLAMQSDGDLVALLYEQVL